VSGLFNFAREVESLFVQSAKSSHFLIGVKFS